MGGRHLPSVRPLSLSERGFDLLLTGSLDCLLVGDVGPRRAGLGLVSMGGGGGLVMPTAPCEMSV